MPAAAITGAVGLYGAHEQSKANDKAVDAQQDASAAAIAEQRRQFDLMHSDLQPYMGAGTNALADLGKLSQGDYSGFENSPDFLYNRDQMQYVVDHSAANAGDLYSGGHSLDLANEMNGIASQNLGAYRNQLFALAGMGQRSAAGVGAEGMGMADNIGNYLGNAANAAAYGAQNQADINSGLVGGLGGLATNWFNGRANQGASYGGGSNASSFGLPAPVDPYQNTNYGTDSWDWG